MPDYDNSFPQNTILIEFRQNGVIMMGKGEAK